jgi:hypothetical protein
MSEWFVELIRPGFESTTRRASASGILTKERDLLSQAEPEKGLLEKAKIGFFGLPIGLRATGVVAFCS